MKCDFCGQEVTQDELTILPVGEFAIPELKYVNLSWGWGGCPDCAVYMDKGGWQGLLDRAIAHHAEGERIRPYLGIIYWTLFDHQTGPLRGWDPEIDDRETH